MDNQDNRRISVKATGGNVVDTHIVDEQSVAVLDRHASAFVFQLAEATGKSESWALDLIVETYAKEFGLEPPDLQ